VEFFAAAIRSASLHDRKSRIKWEGDTLVIDTVNFKNGDQTWLDGAGRNGSAIATPAPAR
jgi:hypothetical protein